MRRTIGGLAQTASEQLVTVECELARWILAESTGAAAAYVRLWDGDGNSSILVAPVRVPSATSVESSSYDGPIPITIGLFLEVVSGSVDWSVTFDDLAP